MDVDDCPYRLTAAVYRGLRGLRRRQLCRLGCCLGSLRQISLSQLLRKAAQSLLQPV